jgi:hypothetical protein
MRSTWDRLRILAIAIVSLFCAAPSLHAQEGSGGQGAGAGQSAAPAQGEPSASQGAPGPVGGVEQYRLEGSGLGHSFLVPRLSLQEVYDSNAGYASTSGASEADAVTSLVGGLSLQWQKRNSTLALDYSAAGLIYDLQTQPNSVVQQFGLTQKYTLRRWNLLIGENFSYLPNSQFGLGGLGLSGGPSTSLPSFGGSTGFNPNFQSGSTIGSGNVYQLASTTAVQAQYTLGGRSSLSFAGSVGFLHFFGDEMLDSRDIIARAGYDRMLTGRDTISFSYTASVLTYPSGIQGFYAQSVQLGYRRVVTGRLHLSVSGGPVVSHFSPQNGQTTVQGSQNSVNTAVGAALDYALRRGNLNVAYSRGVTGGSGLLVGAVTDQLSGSLTQRIGRVWTASFTGSFARNSSFQQTAQTGMPGTTSVFDYWNGGVSVSRPVGRYSSVRFSYNAQRQTSNATVCANGLACGPISLVQVIGMSFDWTTRPYKLD